MITSIKQFIKEKKDNPSLFKSINEEFDEMEMGAEEVDDTTDVEETEEEAVTLESFTALLDAAHEQLQAECEEGQECAPMLSPEQIEMVFGVVQGMLNTEEIEGEEETEEAEADEDMPTDFEEEGEEFEEDENFDESLKKKTEIVEEGLGDFFRGGSKEEIAKKKEEITNKFNEIVNKYEGKTLLFKNYGGNDKPVPFNLSSALSIAGKNNYLGSVQVIPRGEQFIVVWKDGKKGMQKVGSGASAQTTGA